MTDQNATPILPTTPPPTGTIDITDLVERMKAIWIKFATDSIFELASTNQYMFWLKWPVVNQIAKLFIKLVVSQETKLAEQGAFFLNTAIRKASQAGDFISAVDAKNALPPTASKEDFENAEKAQMAAFRNFVLITN